MVVYVDLLFLVNLFIDGVLLYATARVCKIEVRAWRLTAASAIGGAYVVMVLFPELSALYTFVVKFAFSAIMLLTAFGFGGWKRFWRTMGAFYLVSFAAAGGIFGLHYFFASSGDVFNGIWYTHSGGVQFSLQVGLGFTLVALVAVLAFVVRTMRSAKQRERMLAYIAEVSVKLGDNSLSCKGLIDTGNHLYDPLTKTPVMVMESGLWKGMVPESWLPLLRRAEADRILSSPEADEFAWRDRLRLVPYRGVNRTMQFMLAIKPDEVTVVYHDREIKSSRVLVGFEGGTLSSDGSYRAIIHPMLMEA